MTAVHLTSVCVAGVSSWEGKDLVGERGANGSQMCAVKTYGS